MKSVKLTAVLAACVSYGSIAQAQVAADQAAPARTSTPSQATAGEDQLQPASATPESSPQQPVHGDQASDDTQPATDIVVTGSRIVRDGSRAPTPVTVVTAAALQQTAPSNIPDALNKLPIFANSSNQASGASFQAAGTANRTGNFLNLRSLGSDRVLVLLNGSRVPPTTIGNAVDTNVIPNLLVSRVDVVTGGASAAYGSDAVTGVVNFVLDERFKGIKAVVQDGISDKGDNFNYRVGVAAGGAIGERIHLIGSYERFDSDGLRNLFTRRWAPYAPILTAATGSTANPIQLIPNGRSNDATSGGVVTAGPLSTIFPGYTRTRFAPNGTLVPFVRGTATANATRDIGGDGSTFGDRDTIALVARLKTDQAFGRGLIDITDRLQFYAQGSYARSETSGNTSISSNPVGNAARRATIFADNPYLNLTAAQRALIPATGIVVGRAFTDLPQMTQRTVVNFRDIEAGFKGDFGGSWKWDVNYVNGRSKYNLSANELNSRNYFAAVDAVDAGQFATGTPNGRIVCRVTLVNPTLVPGCVPINILGEGNVSPEAFAFVRQDSKSQILNRLWYANANVTGELFQLPAGAVSIALGGEYREQKLDQTSNADPAVFSAAGYRDAYFGNTNAANPSVRGVPSGALSYLVTNVGLASGSQTVKEGYGELLVPIFKDQPFAQTLELNLAGRYTHYRTSGGVTTYKAGLVWAPISDIRLRGTYSRDIAAPSLYSLFAGANVATAAYSDYLTGVANTLLVTTSGNANLNPERARTTVLGIVLTPRFLPGVTMTIDAYRINIKDAIQDLSVESIASTCQASNQTGDICSRLVRPISATSTAAGNYPTQILVSPENLARLETQGIDFELGYTTALDGLLPSIGGNLALRAFVNYLDKYDTQSAGQAVIHRAGKVQAAALLGGLPKWRGLLTQTYTNGRFSIGFNERFTGSYYRGTTEVFGPGVPTRSPNRTYVDTNITYDILDQNRVQLFFNVQNLFDVEPPVLPNTTATNNVAPTDKALYDVIGRQFTTGVRVRF